MPATRIIISEWRPKKQHPLASSIIFDAVHSCCYHRSIYSSSSPTPVAPSLFLLILFFFFINFIPHLRYLSRDFTANLKVILVCFCCRFSSLVRMLSFSFFAFCLWRTHSEERVRTAAPLLVLFIPLYHQVVNLKKTSTVSISHYSQSLVFKTKGRKNVHLCALHARHGQVICAASVGAAAASVDVVGGSSD